MITPPPEVTTETYVPPSERVDPSAAVVWAVNELKRQNFALNTAVDVGCGRGRNSLYLAQQGMDVTAMDFTPNAIEALQKKAEELGLSDKIRPIPHDVVEEWPITYDHVDLVVDTFCFKHIVPSLARQGYKKNLLQVLGLRGHYLISLASIGDGYYGRYARKKGETDPESGGEVVIDRIQGGESVVFNRDHVIKFFAPELDISGEMKHNQHTDETYALLFKRRLSGTIL